MPHPISTEPFIQMLKSITQHKRTGLLKVERLEEKRMEHGEIYFESGRPLWARTAHERDKEALNLISSWKQITCSFDGLNRPYPGNVPALAAPKEPQAYLSPPSGHSITDADLTRKPQELAPEKQTGKMSRVTIPITPRVEPITSTSVKTPIFSQQQSLMRENAAEQSAQGYARVSQHWTRPTPPEAAQQPRMPRPPVTPRQGSVSADGFLPGRLAVFKTRSLALTMQSMQQMERRERIIYVLLDGYRTVENIAKLTHRSETEIEQILVDLTHRGCIEYVGRQTPAPTTHEKMASLLRDESRV